MCLFAAPEKSSLTCLTRLAQRNGEAGSRLLTAALAERLEVLAAPALEVTLETRRSPRPDPG